MRRQLKKMRAFNNVLMPQSDHANGGLNAAANKPTLSPQATLAFIHGDDTMKILATPATPTAPATPATAPHQVPACAVAVATMQVPSLPVATMQAPAVATAPVWNYDWNKARIRSTAATPPLSAQSSGIADRAL